MSGIIGSSQPENPLPIEFHEIKRPFVAVGLPTFDDVKADFALSSR
jgi:hypothetical protein